MTVRVRTCLAAVSCCALLLLLLAALVRLPAYGHYPGPYGTVLNTVAPTERKIANVVTAINFDYRGMDTLGEEYILFAAVAGITLVLRTDRKRTTDVPLKAARTLHAAGMTDALRLFTVPALALTVAFGTYLAIHAPQTPGGGFQGGAVLAGTAALIILGFGYTTFVRVAGQDGIESIEAAGAGAYAAIGLATLVASGAFLKNVLPLGGAGMLFSTGTIAVINACVAVEVCAGLVLLFLEFAHETRVEHAEPEQR